MVCFVEMQSSNVAKTAVSAVSLCFVICITSQLLKTIALHWQTACQYDCALRISSKPEQEKQQLLLHKY